MTRSVANIALLFVLFCTQFLFCQVDAQVDDKKAEESVVIAVSEDSYPFHFRGYDGKAAGIFVDLWKLWSEKTKTPVEFKIADWPETLAMVKEGRADIHAGCFYSKQRDEYLDYSSKLQKCDTHFFFHESITGINSLEDLKPFRIGVVKKDFAEEFIHKNLPGAVIVPYANHEKLIEGALKKEVMVFVADTPTALYLLNKKAEMHRYRYYPNKPLYTSQFLAAVKDGNKKLADKIEAGMKMISNEERVKIKRKWVVPSRIKFDTLIIACSYSYRPFSFLSDSGTPTGFFVDIWRLWAKKQNKKVEFIFSDWAGTLNAIKDGRADFHSGLLKSASRSDWMEFSSPIYEVGSAIFYAPDYFKFKDISDLKGKPVATVKESFQENFLLKNNPELDLVRYNTFDSIHKAAVNRDVAAFMEEMIPVYARMIAHPEYPRFKSLPEPVFRRKVFAGVLKKKAYLMKDINEGLKKITTEEWRNLEEKWIVNPKERIYSKHTEKNSHPEATVTNNTPKIDLTYSEKQWINANREITIAFDGDYAPYSYKDSKGNFIGIAVDFANEISDRTGLKLKFYPKGVWKELYSAAQRREVDVIATLVMRPKRHDLFLFTKPYISLAQYIITTKENKTIKTRDDIAGKTLALVKSYSTSKHIMEEFSDVTPIYVKSLTEAIETVALGKADATVAGLGMGQYRIAKMGLTNLRFAALYAKNISEQRFGVRKDWPILNSILEKALESITDEERLHIFQRWTQIDVARVEAITGDEGFTFTPEELKWLQEHPVIRYGVDPLWPPFDFVDNNNSHSGLSADYIKLISERTGIEFQRVPNLEWKGVLDKVRDRKLDLVSLCQPTPQRAEYLKFSDPYVTVPSVIIARSDFNRINGLEDLKNKKVAMVEGYAVADRTREEFPKVNIKEVSSTLKGLEMVATGEIDYFVDNLGVISYLIKENSLTNLHVIGSSGLAPQKLGLGIRSDWPELVSILNKALNSITQEEKNQIQKRWIQLGDDVQKVTPSSYIQNWLLTAVVIFIVLVLSYYLTSKYIGKREILPFGSMRFRIFAFVALGGFISLTILASIYVLNYNKKQLDAHLETSLITVLQAAASSIDVWLDGQKKFVGHVGVNSELGEKVDSLLRLKVEKNSLLDSDELADIRSFFNSRRYPAMKNGFFILDPEGFTIASRHDADIGRINLIKKNRPDLFNRALNGEVVFVPPIVSDIHYGASEGDSRRGPHTIFIIGPVYHKGKVIAVLSECLNIKETFTQVTRLGRLGKSGETYAFENNGILLTESRFDHQLKEIGLIKGDEKGMIPIEIRDPGGNMLEGFRPTIPRKELPLTLMAKNAIEGRDGVNIEGYRDYRGVSVCGAWLWDEQLDIGLTTEIDYDEAFASYETMKITVFSILGVTLLISSIGLTLLLLFGEKANSELEKSRDELELRVIERTAELKKLSEAVEQSPASVVITDTDGNIEYINPAFTTLTGYTSEEAIGQNPRILKREGVQNEELYQELWKTISSGEVWHGEFCNKKKDGTLFWEAASIAPIIGTDNNITHYVAVKEDITEAKDAQIEHEINNKRLEILVRVSDYNIVDTRSFLDYALDEVLKLTESEFGYIYLYDEETRKFTLNTWSKGVMEDCNVANPETTYDLDKTGLWGEVVRQRKAIVANDYSLSHPKAKGVPEGHIKMKRFMAIPLFDNGKIVLTVGVANRKAEYDQIIIKQLTLLMSSVWENIKGFKYKNDLITARAAADTANKAKGEFLANMSHEIRTPMNAVIGLQHLLNKTKLNKRQKDYSTKIGNAARSLLGIINDILDFSKIESGKLDIENIDFDLNEVLDGIAAIISIKAQEKGLELVFAIEPGLPHSLVGDPLRLNQIILNLLNNAIKFTDKGEIIVSGKLIENRDAKIVIQFDVKDSGIGLSEEQKGKLFQSFSQADASTTRKYGGSGLGLAISKHLVEKMGGEIWVESEPGVGSTFSFTVELGLAEKKVEVYKNLITDIKSKRILIVDDNDSARTVIAGYIEDFSLEFTAVASGEQALEELEESSASGNSYDLVLLDWKMPGINGIETTRRINELYDHSDGPEVIMVTNYGRDEIIREAEENGIEHFLVKPVTQSMLFDSIMDVFGAKINHHSDYYSNGHPESRDLLKGLSVLIVEDNEINQLVAKGLLEEVGIKTELASNGIEACKAIENGIAFDAVLMDLQMPEMDGFEATEKIRSRKEFVDLPIIAMSADAMEGVKEKCFDVGMNEFLTKPIEPEDLFNTLSKYINGESGIKVVRKKHILVEDIEGVNVILGIKRIGGNREMYKKVLNKFVENNSCFVDQIKKLIEMEDVETVRKMLHAFKGVSGNIGAETLYNIASEISVAVKENKPGKVGVLLNHMDDSIKKLIEKIKKLEFEEHKKGKRLEAKPEKVEEKIKTLASLLSKNDFDAPDCFADLEAMTPNDEELFVVSEMIGNYQYDKALEFLKQYAQRNKYNI